MALSDTDINTLAAAVAARLAAQNLGGDSATRMDVTEHAITRCTDYAPAAPLPAVREAAYRYAAWLADSRPALRSLTLASADGTSVTKEFNMSLHGAGFRHSGAMSELARFVVRRAGAIG